MSSNQTHDDAARAKARQLADRLKNDAGFRQQIEQDPIATLTGAGLSELEAYDFLYDAGMTPDVSGYARCLSTCLIATCHWSCLITAN
jgi:hypothetical protein